MTGDTKEYNPRLAEPVERSADGPERATPRRVEYRFEGRASDGDGEKDRDHLHHQTHELDSGRHGDRVVVVTSDQNCTVAHVAVEGAVSDPAQ